jgi:histidine triad (HIT) family protein
MDEDCVFCRIIGGEETVSLVYEDHRAMAFMDIHPVSPGHVLVASKQHHQDFFEIPAEEAAHCLIVAHRLARGIRQATASGAVNLFSANGRAGGQDVPHFQLQLPKPGAPVPSRSDLDVMAVRIGRAIQNEVATL